LTRLRSCDKNAALSGPGALASSSSRKAKFHPVYRTRISTDRLVLAALLIPILLAGCLEPGSTPLGPDNSPAPLPEDAEILLLDGVDLGLVVTTIEESRPLFATDMLFCGFDPASGFRSEPVFRFDMADFEEILTGVESAKLIPGFPDPSADELWLGDNPDLGKEIFVRVWRLAGRDFGEEILTDLASLTPDAWPVTDSSVQLQSGTTGIDLPADSVSAWLGAADTLNLALEYRDAESETGVIRLFSSRSDSSSTFLQITPVNEDLQSREAVDDGLLAAKLDEGAEFDGRLLLATGVSRDVHLALNLPARLNDPDIILIRAILGFQPDSSGLFGMSPADREDNDLGGFYLFEGGLSLALRAVDSDDPESADYEEGTLLENAIALFEDDPTYDDDTGDQLTATRLKTPFRLPLTRWIQDWANGEDENFGLSLSLRGEDERLRQVELRLDGAEPDLAPQLEIIYVRRPDFD
jgi:hypothetical protein